MLRLHCAVAVLLAVASGAAFAQMYRWTDENGKVHFTDTPPPAGAKNVQKRRGTSYSSAAQSEPGEPYVLQEARKKSPVTLFSAPGCDPCGSARQLLNARGVPFREVSVVDEKQFDELQKTVGTSAVPSLVVGSAVQQGFLESAYHAMLDAAGYPKAGVLPPRAQTEPKPPSSESETPLTQAEEERPTGPYAPGAPRQGAQRRKK